MTATGEVREVTADTEPDLFWAFRGGRGNFGITTELEIDLVPVHTLYGGGLFFPGHAHPACSPPSAGAQPWLPTN